MAILLSSWLLGTFVSLGSSTGTDVADATADALILTASCTRTRTLSVFVFVTMEFRPLSYMLLS